MKNAQELASTLVWLAKEGVISGLHPQNVRDAAALLIEQEAKINELEEILAANKHTATVSVLDGRAPYSKEIRVRLDIVDPRPFWARYEIQEYLLSDMSPDYLREAIARGTVRMAVREFEDVMVESVARQLYSILEQTAKVQTDVQTGG